MIKAFRKYDKQAIKQVQIGINELNALFEQTGCGLIVDFFQPHTRISTICKKPEYQTMGHDVVASIALGITIVDWHYADDKRSVKLYYR